jgi:UDP-3-O-acyl-N-acetylglucosamine deacetylase
MTLAPAASAEIRGRGLHSGAESAVRIFRREPAAGGLRFLWPGLAEPLAAEALGHLPRHSRRGTALVGATAPLRTPEHLLAAALFFAEAPLDIVCDASEVPGLDGSARPFFEALSAATGVATEAAPRPAWREYPCDLNWAYAGREGSIMAEPASRFSVEYVLDRPPLSQTYRLADPGVAAREILPARTFIFWREWAAVAPGADLLAGAGPDSGMLYAASAEEFEEVRRMRPELGGKRFPLLHPEAERVEQEAVKHKILDLLGDLALLGLKLPRLRLLVRNGGHALNHLLLERLQHE